MRSSMLACALALSLAGCDRPAPAASPAPASAAAATAPAPQVVASAVGADTLMLPSRKADRLAAPDVTPVVRDGVTYAQAADGREAGLSQSRGVLVASDAASGKQLWAVAVYPEVIDAAREADVQWVFFRSMAFDPDGRMRVVNEHGEAFLVDVRSHQVSSAP